MNLRNLGLVSLALLAGSLASEAATVKWNVTANWSCDYYVTGTGGTGCTTDGTFTPQSFSLTTEIDPVPTSSSGPTTSSHSGTGYAYDYRRANQNYAVTPSLLTSASPFATILDSYLAYGGALGTYQYAQGQDQFFDYTYGGTDFGSTNLRVYAYVTGSSCVPSCGGSAYTVSGYQQYLQLYMANNTLNAALSDVTSLTLADYLALIETPGTYLQFTNVAYDYSYDVTCATSCSAFWTKLDGKQYSGAVTATVVPEPGTLGLAGLGLLGVGVARRGRGKGTQPATARAPGAVALDA